MILFNFNTRTKSTVMIRNYFLCLGFLITQLAFAQNTPNYVPTDNLEAWWSFEENAEDLSLNGRDGVLYNIDFLNDFNSNPLSSAYFNGTSSNYIGVTNSSNLNFSESQNYTIALWLEPFNNPNNGVHSGILSKWDENQHTTSYPYRIAITDLGNGYSELFWVNYYSPTATIHSLSTILINNRYIHVAFVAENNIVSLYINGQYESSLPYASLDYNNNSEVLIGKRSTPNNRRFKGKIDELGIWSRALNECEIKALANFSSDHLVEIEVINSNDTLIASSNTSLEPISYQWYSCENNVPEIISGANSNFFFPNSSGEYYVELFFSDLECSLSSGCFNSQTVSINEIAQIKSENHIFNLFPNPSSSQMTIQLNHETKELKSKEFHILDSNGKTVLVGELDHNVTTIYLEDFTTGTYLFSIPSMGLSRSFIFNK